MILVAQSHILLRLRQLWAKFFDKAYRDEFVSSHLSSNIANQIATLRESRGWTQEELATAAGMKQSRISLLENPSNESVNMNTLKRIASAFDVGIAVRFVPYSNILNWAANPQNELLDVKSFQDDTIEQHLSCTTVSTAEISASVGRISATVSSQSTAPLGSLPAFVIASRAQTGDARRAG